MKGLVLGSVVCLLAAIAWSVWGGGADVPAGVEPQSGRSAEKHAARRSWQLPELAQPEVEATEPQEATENDGAEGDADAELATVRGRVVASVGQLADNTRVLLDAESDGCVRSEENPDCEHTQIWATADAETGDFEAQAPAGSYTVVARSEGLLPAGERGLKLSAGETVEGLMLTLEPGGHITGVVVSDGEPQPAVRVVATGEGYVRAATSDDFGHFDVTGLPVGQFTVRAFTGFLGGDEKTARTGATVSLDLARRERLRGRVLDPRGFPAEGVTVFSDFIDEPAAPDSDPWPNEPEELYGMGAHGCSDDCYQRGVTDASGTFEIAVAPGETLIIGARRGDERALAEDVSRGTSELELTLLAPLRTRLVDEDGVPVVGLVQAEPPSRFWENGISAAEDGTLTIPRGDSRTLIVPKNTHLEGELPADLEVQEREQMELVY